jgi:heme-degrading monooxygenase HmoA
VVVRIWKGRTRAEDADAYTAYMDETGVKELAATPGNEGVQMWRRLEGDEAEFVVMSLWDSRASIVAFAGEDIEVARYYPEDDRYLLVKDPHVLHYDVVASG